MLIDFAKAVCFLEGGVVMLIVFLQSSLLWTIFHESLKDEGLFYTKSLKTKQRQPQL